jgi:non-heme chloroperoxidase
VVPPLLVKTAANPEGLPIDVFDGLRSSLAKDRSQFYKDFAVMFYGANRPGASVSQGMRDQFWLWSMQAGLKNSYDSIKAFSETDFTEDLKKFDVPTVVMHGEDDQVVPIKDSAKKSAKLIKGAQEIYYPGRPHGLTATHQDEVDADQPGHGARIASIDVPRPTLEERSGQWQSTFIGTFPDKRLGHEGLST